jgi:pimeloyl-ACP methyl ester carboxylesterase
MVLCNGYVCTTQYWPAFVREFASDHTVVQWDYRSHGRSEVPRDRLTQNIPQYAADLGQVLDDLGIEQPVLVGHSMGVQVVLALAGLWPERVRGLVALCGTYQSPFAAWSEAPWLGRTLDALARAALRTEPVFWPVLRRLLRTDLAISISYRMGANRKLCPREYLDALFAHVTSMDGAAAIQAFRGLIEYSAVDVLGALRMPTLVIGGSADRTAPPALSRAMHARIPGSELEIFDECSHLAMIERPAEVHARIRRFLREHQLT